MHFLVFFRCTKQSKSFENLMMRIYKRNTLLLPTMFFEIVPLSAYWVVLKHNYNIWYEIQFTNVARFSASVRLQTHMTFFSENFIHRKFFRPPHPHERPGCCGVGVFVKTLFLDRFSAKVKELLSLVNNWWLSAHTTIDSFQTVLSNYSLIFRHLPTVMQAGIVFPGWYYTEVTSFTNWPCWDLNPGLMVKMLTLSPLGLYSFILHLLHIRQVG